MPRSKPLLYCSFCRKDENGVEKLIGGPGIYICDACVAQCDRILDGKRALPFPGWPSLSTVELLKTLPPSSAAVEATRAILQEHVDLLRKRGVSWAEIGDALGISRQAAWERFS
jgi:ClpX C4-type zinc finger